MHFQCLPIYASSTFEALISRGLVMTLLCVSSDSLGICQYCGSHYDAWAQRNPAPHCQLPAPTPVTAVPRCAKVRFLAPYHDVIQEACPWSIPAFRPPSHGCFKPMVCPSMQLIAIRKHPKPASMGGKVPPTKVPHGPVPTQFQRISELIQAG